MQIRRHDFIRAVETQLHGHDLSRAIGAIEAIGSMRAVRFLVHMAVTEQSDENSSVPSDLLALTRRLAPNRASNE